MATPTKKARGTIFSWRFMDQVNGLSNSLYCQQLLQWLVEWLTDVGESSYRESHKKWLSNNGFNSPSVKLYSLWSKLYVAPSSDC